jgi:hypothetical protein
MVTLPFTSATAGLHDPSVCWDTEPAHSNALKADKKNNEGKNEDRAILLCISALLFSFGVDGYRNIALHSTAGWKINKPIGSLIMLGSPTGISIKARDMKSPAAIFLLDSLRSVGLEVTPIELPAHDSDVIILSVGSKKPL